MRIVLVLESADPAADGLARSLTAQAQVLREGGHEVLTVAPAVHDATASGSDVVLLGNVPVLADTGFALSLPLSSGNSEQIRRFRPDVVHAHHPFIVSGAALRIAADHSVPLVFTHHAPFERDARYVPPRSLYLSSLAGELAVGFSRLADCVLAPNHSVAAYLRDRDIHSPIEMAPPGIDVSRFAAGLGARVRGRLKIPDDAFVAGCSAPPPGDGDFNFLSGCIARFLKRNRSAHVLVLGANQGSMELQVQLARNWLMDRAHFVADADPGDVADCYAAMDVFLFVQQRAFESLELLEAMAAGTPVLARDAPATREVVVDGRNGRLLRSASFTSFAEALEDLARANPAVLATWSENARKTASRFEMPGCADRHLELYRQLVDAAPDQRQRSGSDQWESIRRRVDAEWRLWTTRTRAAGAALTHGPYPSRVPVLRHVIRLWRTFRRWVSRREWSVRLLNLPAWENASDEPGLVLLQIDGLSRQQLEQALARGQMPFLRRVLDREAYRIETLYSGQPATTPAVLGELYYGVRQAVPAFGFRDHRSGEVVEMFQPGIAACVERELAKQGEGLLSEGCAYSVIYSGGAYDSSFCPATTGWRNIEDAAMWRRIALFLMNVVGLARIAVLSLIELIRAVRDCFRGFLRREWRQELMYVPRRLFINIVLRELLGISVEVDVTRGVPVIHANFLGYDENAHRRGPGSRLAHAALPGIDRVLRRIWNAAHASQRRHYHVWIMSDHGQETTAPYDLQTGQSIDSAVQSAFDRMSTGNENGRRPRTVAIGPIGYVYWPAQLPDEERARIASALQSECRIPLVMARQAEGVLAWTATGRYRMPEQASEVLAENHPHLPQVAEDLTALCSHPDAGEFLIGGWRRNGTPVSFVVEHGAHGGPGPEETSGFALLPPDAPPHSGRLRPAALRRMGQALLRRERPRRRASRVSSADTLRLVTYNVHSCVGLDGRLSPSRIARVLAGLSPDIVALQELDVRRAWTGSVDQAAEIAHELEMELHFHPCINVTGEQYGNAVLSRFPIRLMKSELFADADPHREPRGALWVRVDTGEQSVDVFTTHLGLSPRERLRQVQELLGREWLAHPDCGEHAVLCGDLNAMPGSRVYRHLARRMLDVQRAVPRHRPRRTWFSPFPLGRIDHVFVSPGIHVVSVDVSRTAVSRVASDHLPLRVDLRPIPSNATDDGSQRSATRSRVREPLST